MQTAKVRNRQNVAKRQKKRKGLMHITVFLLFKGTSDMRDRHIR